MTHLVEIMGFDFEPKCLTIAPGDTVEWVGLDGFHTVTSDPNGEEFDSGFGVDTFVHTFEDTGTYSYHCIPHQAMGMAGTIFVKN